MAKKKPTASKNVKPEDSQPVQKAQNLLEPIPHNDLELYDTDQLVMEISRRCMGCVVVTIEQERAVKKGDKPGFSHVIRSTQNHGAIAVILQCALNVNAHQFAAHLAEQEARPV